MNKVDFKLIYSNLIAGRLPVGSGSAQRVVMHQAYAILGTNRLHTYFVEKNGYVYYFAVESHFLSSVPGFRLPFVDVLPDGPLCQGEGIYLLHGADYTAALIMDGGSLRFLCNDSEVLKDYLIGLDLQVIEIENRGGKALHSIPQTIQGISEGFSKILMRSSLVILTLSSLVFVITQAANVYTQRQMAQGLNARAVENDLNATLKKLSIQQPLARQLGRIQKVSATVVRAGGWIEKYQLKGENSESFELVMPSWVSQDYLDALGRDVVTDLRDMEGLLNVRKKGKRE